MLTKEVFVRQLEKLLKTAAQIDVYYDVLSENVINEVVAPIDLAIEVLSEAMGRPTVKVWDNDSREELIPFVFYDIWLMGDSYPSDTEIKGHKISSAADLYDLIVAEHGVNDDEYNA